MREWFEVDRKGLGKVIARRGIEFVVAELVSNAWDEQATQVNVRLNRSARAPRCALLEVEDDSPGGFANIEHAWVLFAESHKKNDPEARGRFNIGEKMVFALAREARVETVSGTVVFDERGRHRTRTKRERGSRVQVPVPMTNADIARCEALVRKLVPPVTTLFNGTPILAREKLTSFNTTIETEAANDEGVLFRTYRKTAVDVYAPTEGVGHGWVYELGIPVCETGDAYDFDVRQKVPLAIDRDHLPWGYLRDLRVQALNALHDRLNGDATAEWVTDALSHRDVSIDAVKTVVTKRFGERAVAYDPSDTEAVSRATAAGYAIVHGGSLSSAAWENVRKAEALPRAGKIFPTTPNTAPGTEVVPPSEYTPGMKKIVAYAQALANHLLNIIPEVTIVRNPTATTLAQWHHDADDNLHGALTLNLTRLGADWFGNGITDDVVELLSHEFAHAVESNHLSDRFADALAKFCAKIRHLGYLDQIE